MLDPLKNGVFQQINNEYPITIDALKEDSLVDLFSFLPLEDHPRLPLVCKKWSQIARENPAWRLVVEKKLPERIRKIERLTVQEKTKAYLNELRSRVDFVLMNPGLQIHVYLWDDPDQDKIFPADLIEDLRSANSLEWKAQRISTCVNSATFSNKKEKIACYKFTCIISDEDIEEVNCLLKGGFDVNSSLCDGEASKYPTSLFTLFDMGIGFKLLDSKKIVALVKKMIDHGLNVHLVDKNGKTAFDLVRENRYLREEEIVELENYAAQLDLGPQVDS